MTKNNKNKPGQKFYFNTHIFDDVDVIDEAPEEPEELLPIEPVFTKSDVESARKEGFAKGKEEGISETKASRSAHIKNTLDVISHRLDAISVLENERKKNFESDVVDLCRVIFETVFPLYQEQYGQKEMENILSEILETQNKQAEILVRVSPEVSEGIEKFLEKGTLETQSLNVKVLADDSCSLGQAEISWADGGAKIDRDVIISQVQSIFGRVLASDKQGNDDMLENRTQENEDSSQ